mgnify:CR=1 FL=1
MTLQTSGAISLLDIANEFGGSTPHAISEYYGAASGIPSSGTISFSQFYGKSNIVADYLPSMSYSGGTAVYTLNTAFGNIFDGSLTTFATRSTLQPSSSNLGLHTGAIVLEWNNGPISAGTSLRFSAIWPSSFSQTVPVKITDGAGNVHNSTVTSQHGGVFTAPLASLASSYPYASIKKIEVFNGYNPVYFYGIERSGSMLILP